MAYSSIHMLYGAIGVLHRSSNDALDLEDTEIINGGNQDHKTEWSSPDAMFSRELHRICTQRDLKAAQPSDPQGHSDQEPHSMSTRMSRAY